MFKAILADFAHCPSCSYKNKILEIDSISIFSCTGYCHVTQAWGGSVCTRLSIGTLLDYTTRQLPDLRKLPRWHWWPEIARNPWEASRMTSPV
jgi:hypothetical protein